MIADEVYPTQPQRLQPLKQSQNIQAIGQSGNCLRVARLPEFHIRNPQQKKQWVQRTTPHCFG
jgi:hypothetical protein